MSDNERVPTPRCVADETLLHGILGTTIKQHIREDHLSSTRCKRQDRPKVENEARLKLQEKSRKLAGARTACLEWTQMAFDGEEPRFEEPSTTQWGVFIEFYSKCQLETDRHAMDYLNKERGKRGMTTTVSGHDTADDALARASYIKNLPPVKTTKRRRLTNGKASGRKAKQVKTEDEPNERPLSPLSPLTTCSSLSPLSSPTLPKKELSPKPSTFAARWGRTRKSARKRASAKGHKSETEIYPSVSSTVEVDEQPVPHSVRYVTPAPGMNVDESASSGRRISLELEGDDPPSSPEIPLAKLHIDHLQDAAMDDATLPLEDNTAKEGPGISVDALLVKPEPELGDVEMRLVTLEDMALLSAPAASYVPRPVLASPHPKANDTAPILKLRLARKPAIWAQTRQEVCESFPWFRSFQGGVYSNDNVDTSSAGILPNETDSSWAGNSSYLTGNGGKAESLTMQDGRMVVVPAQDQSEKDISVRALLNTYMERRPLVLLVDDNYRLFPYDLRPHGVVYAVLGLYFIKHAWAERQPAGPSNPLGTVVRFKFAFQWCEGQEAPWWASPPSSCDASIVEPVPAHDTPSEQSAVDCVRRRSKAPKKKIHAFVDITRSYRQSELSHRCPTCGEASALVYRSRMCLFPHCSAFWLIDGVHAVVPEALEINPDFLKLDDPCVLPLGLRDVRPPPPVNLDLLCTPSVTTTQPFTQGWHCKQCGRLSCRTYWQKWDCPACDAPPVMVNPLIRDAKDLKAMSTQRVKMNWMHSHVLEGSGIKRLPMRPFADERGAIIGNYQAFELPDGVGTIYHIKSTSLLALQEAQDVFKRYQLDASNGSLNFQRLPLRSHKLRGACLAHYFSHNTGKPYHYVGGGANTVPWEAASQAVLGARELMHKRLRQALGRQEVFNEVLSAAYMESQKMAFHSDAEAGLGPLVAGLSLGAPAFMHFRRVPKKQEQIDGHKGVLLSFKLEHGDVLVMDGTEIQRRYQ
ncbi:hypothetical protein BD626DRAFT_563265 [Schizophyllum amplum]|uniref:Alpha-ketoglutarate-dependent dioxygenase AlkB-like domain-containing protein n=1 Tax=Schizophyllum amplum TaxID=97359 RepID=A0A550CXK3_9AGAR|nr:hypothetical protein BD626DRAFT_563265 [Auriculariopsis ampla]